MRFALTAVIVLSVLSVTLLAGDLTPPAGGVQPTDRNIISALPFTISSPGSYVVTGELQTTPGANGITVNANHVTIDLAGFSLIGNGGGTGILAPGGQDNITIRNGTVRSWGRGISINNGEGHRVEDIRVLSNSNHGIRANGATIHVVRCMAIENGDRGISNENTGFETSIVEACIAQGNSHNGIDCSGSMVIRDCVAHDNRIGIVGYRGPIENSVVSDNGLAGIYQWGTGIMRECLAFSNTNNGLESPGGGAIESSRSLGNNQGVRLAGSGGYGVGNFVGGNSTAVFDSTGSNHLGTVVTTPVGANAWDNLSY